MHYPDYNSGKIVLMEGEWFLFLIHNLVQLQDDDWYFVLQDVNGLKHFMPAGFYKNYGLKPGDEISCKIDRINCTGRIFLEPRHPVYADGKNYFFDILHKSDQDGGIKLIVKDIFENNIEVPVKGLLENAIFYEKKVQCVVLAVKKGLPILEIA